MIPYNFLMMYPNGVVALQRAVYGLSINTFGFTPTLKQVTCSTYTPGQFVIYIELPVWPTGSTHTTAAYATALRALSKQYTVGIGELLISIEFTPST